MSLNRFSRGLNVGCWCAFFLTVGLGATGDESTWFDTVSANPTSLFPLTNNDGETGPVVDLMFEELAERHWDTYDWKPKIASRWEISPDGKQYTFWIDPKAKFWNGDKVTPEDVKFSYDMIFMEGMNTAVLRPYYENIEKLEVVGADAVRFSTKNVYFKNFDVAAGLTIFQKKHYENLIKQDKTMTKAEVTKVPMGTSPWRLEKWDENQQIILKRDPSYWNKEQAEKEGRWNTARRVVRIIPESAVEYESFKKGDITMHAFTPKEWALDSDGPEFKSRIVKVKSSNKAPKGYSYIGWNQKDPMLKDKNVRWAMTHLVNLKLWIKKFDFDLSEPAIGPISPKIDDHDPALGPVEFSLDKARTRLAAAGWSKAGKDGFLEKDGKRFEVTIIYAAQAKEVWEPKLTEFKNTAAKVGVLINLKALEWTSMTKLLDEHKFQGIAMAWGAGSVEPDFKQIWHSASADGGGSNHISYVSPEADKLIDEHRATLDRAKRIELARKFERLVYDDQPYTFLTASKFVLYAHQNYVKKERDTFNYTVGTEFWKMQPK